MSAPVALILILRHVLVNAVLALEEPAASCHATPGIPSGSTAPAYVPSGRRIAVMSAAFELTSMISSV